MDEVRRAEFRKAGKKMKGLLCSKKFILLKRMGDLRGCLEYLRRRNLSNIALYGYEKNLYSVEVSWRW